MTISDIFLQIIISAHHVPNALSLHSMQISQRDNKKRQRVTSEITQSLFSPREAAQIKSIREQIGSPFYI